MRQFFSFAFLSAISYLCHRVFDKSKWNTKDTAFKVDKSLPRLLPYAVCQIVRFDWNFWWQKVPKTIRMSLSREQPPARVERAQQEQDYAASRSGHAGCRLFSFRCKRECGGLKPLPGAIVGFCASCLSRTHPSRRGTRRTIPARCRSCETKSRLKVARNGAGLLANPRIGARFER